MSRKTCPVCNYELENRIYEPCCSLSCSMRYKPPDEVFVREPDFQDSLVSVVVDATETGMPDDNAEQNQDKEAYNGQEDG